MQFCQTRNPTSGQLQAMASAVTEMDPGKLSKGSALVLMVAASVLLGTWPNVSQRVLGGIILHLFGLLSRDAPDPCESYARETAVRWPCHMCSCSIFRHDSDTSPRCARRPRPKKRLLVRSDRCLFQDWHRSRARLGLPLLPNRVPGNYPRGRPPAARGGRRRAPCAHCQTLAPFPDNSDIK